MRRTLALALLLAAAVATAQEGPGPRPAAPEAAPTLDGMLARFRAMPGLSARFREEKRIALLAAPLVNEGTLHYAPPARVARHVLSPVRQTVLIEGATVRMGDAGQSETLSLKGNPVLREFLDSFLKLLAGDRAALEQGYALTFTPAADDRWELELVPRRAPMKDAIARIAFSGRGLVMERMLIIEVGGDEARTTFSEVDPARTYTPEEQAEVFRLPPAPEEGR